MGRDVIVEQVPGFTRRDADVVLAGSNNTLVLLGTDRPSDVNSGYSDSAGTVYVVTGRAGVDPDFERDRAFSYLSARTDPDGNLNDDRGPGERGVSASLVKADVVRIHARQSLRVVVGRATLTMRSDGTVVIDGDNIKLGENATERVLRGETFVRWAEAHRHPTPSGVSGTPIDPVPDAAFSQRKATVD